MGFCLAKTRKEHSESAMNSPRKRSTSFCANGCENYRTPSQRKIGRPDHVQLVFERRVNRRTPGRFRTRVITEGVTPSLHVDYKHTRIKQYHKEGRALRTETTINNTRDFGLGKTDSQSSGAAEGGLSGQSTSARRPTNESRLCHWRRRIRQYTVSEND